MNDAPKLISRKDALAAGARYYFTGKPCRNGHVAKRLTARRGCVACNRAHDKARYVRDPERHRMRCRKAAWKRNGFPEPTRPRPDVCDLCKRPPTARALHLDHDHATGAFRGWLCHYCNTNLGRFSDSVEGLLRAIRYLQGEI